MKKKYKNKNNQPTDEPTNQTKTNTLALLFQAETDIHFLSFLLLFSSIVGLFGKLSFKIILKYSKQTWSGEGIFCWLIFFHKNA